MDLWILYNDSFKENMPNPATRMYDEAIKNNIDAKLLFYPYLKLINDKIYYENEEMNDLPKIALLRGNDTYVSKMLEDKGIKVINSTYTINNCCDKLLTHKHASKLNIDQIKTIHFKGMDYKKSVEFAGLPFILKYRFGKQGQNIYIINNENEFNDIIKNINPDDYILQEYIKTSYGKDVRVFIIGNNVVGACKRENKDGFMSNLAQGGLSYDYPLNDKLINDSLRLKEELKGDIISVDYVFGENELLFCEANTNPGFASFNYLGYPMRELFMKYILKLLNK